MSLLEILCSLCSSCVLLLLHVFFVFKGLWWKFFGALEASICRTSLICGFLKFLEAFELDSSEFWDLGRWFEWFCFEYSLYSRLKFLKFLEALGLDSMIKASVLLNLLWCCLWHGVFQDVVVSSKISSKMFWFVFVCRNALGRLLFIRIWGWVSDMWWSLIDDMCHSLIGGVLRLFLQDTWYQLIGQNVLIFKATHVSNRLDRSCHCLHTLMCGLCHYLHMPMCDLVFACFLCFYFNDTWQISVGFWMVIAKPSNSTWCFVISHVLWTW